MANISRLTEENLPSVPLREIGRILLKHIETPIGTMVACATDKGICMLEFSDSKVLEAELKDIAQREKTMVVQGESPYFAPLQKELSE